MNIQPSKKVSVPSGATHWNNALVNPFFKIEEDDVYQYLNGSWEQQYRPIVMDNVPVDNPLLVSGYSVFRSLVPLRKAEIPLGSARVVSKFGAATLVDGAYFLDNNPFVFEPVMLFPSDILFKSTIVYAGDGNQRCTCCGRIFEDLDLVLDEGRCPSDDCPGH